MVTTEKLIKEKYPKKKKTIILKNSFYYLV